MTRRKKNELMKQRRGDLSELEIESWKKVVTKW